MKRYEILELRGKRFALALTIHTQIELEEKFGKDFDLNKILYQEERKKIYKNTLFMLHLMAEDGAAYARIFEGKDFDSLTEEEYGLFIKLTDINKIREAIASAALLGYKRDIELEENEKNVEAPGE